MKKLLIIAILFALQIPLAGQNTAKMNTIKRDSLYLYSEATMENAAEAYEVANTLLLARIKEYADERKAVDGKDLVIKDILDSQDSLQFNREDMVKVFLYVKKPVIESVDSVTVQSSAAPASPEPETTPAVTSEASPAVAAEPSPAAPAVPSPAPAAEPSPAVAVEPAPAAPAEPSPEETNDPSLKLEAVWQQGVIDQLLSADGYLHARSLLSRAKAEFKIKKIGPMVECKNPAEVYLLVGKNGSVVTVLGPGTDSRTDFKALKKTSDSYDGYDKVWFTFSK